MIEKDKLEKITKEYIKLTHVMPGVNALEGGVIAMDRFLMDFYAFVDGKVNVHGKCPIDGRIRPVYIRINGADRRIMVIADGKGHAFRPYTEGLGAYGDQPKPENLIAPDTYEFVDGLSGMDF